jgi:hypothetical protein
MVQPGRRGKAKTLTRLEDSATDPRWELSRNLGRWRLFFGCEAEEHSPKG